MNDREQFYGNVSGTRSVGSFTLSEISYWSGLRLPKHRHEQPYFCFVLTGECTEVHGAHARYYSRSSLVFHPAGETHSALFHTDTRCLNIQINARWLERGRYSRILNGAIDVAGGRLAYLAAGLEGSREKVDTDCPG